MFCPSGLTSFKYYSCQNFGIIVAFGVVCLSTLLLFTEFNTSYVSGHVAVLFKRGPRSTADENSHVADEEALKGGDQFVLEKARDGACDETQKQDVTYGNQTAIFSWQHIRYTIALPGHEKRELLSNISGYVAPGKLTALMGESGAGKTTLLDVLAQRASVGVVVGDIFVNGQKLPQDFQSQTYVYSFSILAKLTDFYRLTQRILPAVGHPCTDCNCSGGFTFLRQVTPTNFSISGRERGLVSALCILGQETPQYLCYLVSRNA